jgi:hypothetical protein
MNNELAFNNQEKESKLNGFDSIAKDLINDPELQELPGVQRGTTIVDRFIGSIVRHGELQGSKTSYSPADILAGIDNVSSLGEYGLKEITNKENLRVAVANLSMDPDVAKLFGQMSGRLSQDEAGAYTLTSTAQIEGYLLAGGEKNYTKNPVGGVDMHGDSWIPVLMEHTQRMADDPYNHWISADHARELVGSSAPLIKNSGNDWQQANSSARKAGVDLDLLRRSAEKVQDRVQSGHDLGSTALFLATGGRIKSYKQDLNRRSGF